MGIKYSGDSLRNYRICNKHFTSESYIDLIGYKLRNDAVPMAWLSFSKSVPKVLSEYNAEHITSITASGSGLLSSACVGKGNYDILLVF